MKRREQRYRYSRPTVEDRDGFLDRLLWTRERFPGPERVLIAIVVVAILVEIAYQVALAVERGARAVVPY